LIEIQAANELGFGRSSPSVTLKAAREPDIPGLITVIS
jgi:hypothetical protein